MAEDPNTKHEFWPLDPNMQEYGGQFLARAGRKSFSLTRKEAEFGVSMGVLTDVDPKTDEGKQQKEALKEAGSLTPKARSR